MDVQVAGYGNPLHDVCIYQNFVLYTLSAVDPNSNLNWEYLLIYGVFFQQLIVQYCTVHA